MASVKESYQLREATNMYKVHHRLVLELLLFTIGYLIAGINVIILVPTTTYAFANFDNSVVPNDIIMPSDSRIIYMIYISLGLGILIWRIYADTLSGIIAATVCVNFFFFSYSF